MTMMAPLLRAMVMRYGAWVFEDVDDGVYEVLLNVKRETDG